jgi:hypothetical protein
MKRKLHDAALTAGSNKFQIDIDKKGKHFVLCKKAERFEKYF